MKKGDFILLSAAAVMLLAYFIPLSGGSNVNIYVDGTLYAQLPLNENSVTPVKTEFGFNEVVIENGVVSVSDSDCKGGQCRKSSIKKGGQSIVCLPNRLCVIIEGKKGKNETDVVL
ncbi:MAG: NusG domain II-containing protein [Clostridia bacterium]|nr:NusG domain II-containing protein [Clostridia bacterium]